MSSEQVSPPSDGGDTSSDLGFTSSETGEIGDQKVLVRGSWASISMSAVAIGLGLYHLASGYGIGLRYIRHRGVHVAGTLAILLLMAMARTKRPSRRAMLGVLGVVGIALPVFAIFNEDWILDSGRVIEPWMFVWGAAALLVGLEVSRRVVGWVLPAIVVAVAVLILVSYPLSLPSQNWMADIGVRDMIGTLSFSNSGLFGNIMGVSAGVVAAFLLFGAFLSASGGAESFLDLSRFLVGRFRGGPGKVSLVTSAFFGTASGSAVANVVVDGVFNIPLMKKSGFRPSFAAAVEATASTGGQLVPPVMGAAAFVLAEFLGIPYTQVIVAAIVPTFLYYAALFIAIHVEAVRFDLPRMAPEDLPGPRQFINANFIWSFVVPLTILFLSLFMLDLSLLLSAFISTVAIMIRILARRGTDVRHRIRTIFYAFRRAGEDIARVAAIVISAQLLITMLGMSGLGPRVASELSRAPVPVSLALVSLGLIVIILGFGVPTVAAYLLAAPIASPVFFALNIDPLGGHIFLLYMAVFANITPPVMPATYAAAAIARADVVKAGIEGTRLLIPSFFVPFAVVLHPDMLLNRGNLLATTVGLFSVLIGTSAIAVGFARWLFGRIPIWMAILLVAGGSLLAWPGLEPTLAGIAIVGALTLYAWLRRESLESTTDVAPVG